MNLLIAWTLLSVPLLVVSSVTIDLCLEKTIGDKVPDDVNLCIFILLVSTWWGIYFLIV